MQLYKYDNKTKEYIGTINAMVDPLETRKQGKTIFLVDSDSTLIAPPFTDDGYVAVFNGTKWETIKDNRGTEYWFPEDKYGTPAKVMDTLGELPEGAILTPPEKTKEQIKAEKLKAIEDEYLNNYQSIMTYFIKAMVQQNNEVMVELQEELKALDEDYDNSILALEEE